MFNDITGLTAEQVAVLSYEYLRGNSTADMIDDVTIGDIDRMGSLPWGEFIAKADNFLANLWGVEEKGW